VWCDPAGSELAGASLALQVTNVPTLAAPASRASRSDTTASTAAVAMTNGTTFRGRSGGHSTRRRATPSSSMSANAAVS